MELTKAETQTLLNALGVAIERENRVLESLAVRHDEAGRERARELNELIRLREKLTKTETRK